MHPPWVIARILNNRFRQAAQTLASPPRQTAPRSRPPTMLPGFLRGGATPRATSQPLQNFGETGNIPHRNQDRPHAPPPDPHLPPHNGAQGDTYDTRSPRTRYPCLGIQLQEEPYPPGQQWEPTTHRNRTRSPLHRPRSSPWVTLPNPGEGNCLFHAIADSLPTRGDGRRHQSLRDGMVSYMSNETSALEQLWDGTTPRTLSEIPPCHSFREYLQLLRQPGTWTGELELVALGRLLQRPILILRQDHPPLLFGRHATTPRDQGIAIWFHLGHFEGILETIPPLIWATARVADPRHPAWISQPLGQGQPHTADGAPLPLPRGGATSPGSPPTSLTADRELVLRTMAEHTEDFHEYINILHSETATPPQLDLDVFFGSWEAMGQGFSALGYQLDHPCPWRQIGLAKEEGPEPTMETLERRARLLRNLLTAAATQPWAPAAEEQLLRAGARVQLARSTCLQELDAVLTKRKKSRLQVWPRWLELEPSFMQTLPNLLPPGRSSIILTNFSNLMQKDAPELPYTTTPAGTRELARKLVGDAGQVAQTLTQMRKQEVLIWAPPDREALQRLMAGLQRAHLASRDPLDLRLTLLIALDVLPGCDTAAAVLDIFSHPALDKRWEPLRKATQFVLQPVRCVLTGRNGPLYSTRSLLALTFDHSEAPSVTGIYGWRTPLLTIASEGFVLVDCPTYVCGHTHHTLVHLGIHGIIKWEGPLRSPGSCSSRPRSTFRGHLAATASGPLGVQVILHALRHAPGLDQCLMGASTTYTEASTLVVDMGAAPAMIQFRDLCTEAVFVTPSRALITPRGSHSVWEARISDAFRQDPAEAITRISWRQSHETAGRPWVRPLQLDSQIRAARTRARHELGLQTAEADPVSAALLVLRGPLGADSDGLLATLMATITNKIQTPLTPARDSHSLPQGAWAPIRDGGGAWTGQVRLQLSSFGEVQQLYSVVHESVIMLHNEPHLLDLHNAYLDIADPPRQEGNAGGAQA